jgi:hypothetical protein
VGLRVVGTGCLKILEYLEHENLTFCCPKRKIVLVRAIKTKTHRKDQETKMEEKDDFGET